MSICSKFITPFVFILAIFLFSPKVVSAQVVINEFSSKSDPEWVELLNTSSDQVINLSGWRIVDGNTVATDDLTLDGCISPQGFRLFNHTKGWLNDGGDSINLKDSTGEPVGEPVVYGEGGVVGTPSSEKSAGRTPNGASTWVIFDTPTPTNNDCQLSVTSTPTPEPTSSSTPTPTIQPPTPTSLSKATYKINEVKNEDGEVLSSVKIYVDGNYVHHYAPEILTFCDGCKCDADVGCGFGNHTISLEKSGYQNWSETKTINSGNSYEVNPVMNFASSTSSSVPTLSPTTPAKSNLVSAGESATPKEAEREDGSSQNLPGEILGEEATLSGEGTESAAFFTTPSTSPTPALESKSGWQKNLPKIFLILGGGSFLIGGLLLAKQKLKEKFPQSDVII